MMPRMRKGLIAVAASTATLLILAGCAPSDQKPTATGGGTCDKGALSTLKSGVPKVSTPDFSVDSAPLSHVPPPVAVGFWSDGAQPATISSAAVDAATAINPLRMRGIIAHSPRSRQESAQGGSVGSQRPHSPVLIRTYTGCIRSGSAFEKETTIILRPL